MKIRTKWFWLSLCSCSGCLFTSCLGAFWQGFWSTGWPSNNRWLNLAYDVAVEAFVYNQ